MAFTRVVNSPRRGIGQTSLSRVARPRRHDGRCRSGTRPRTRRRCPGLGAAAVKALRALHGDDGAAARARREQAPVGDLLEAIAARDRLPRGAARPSARSRRRAGSRTSRSSSRSAREYDAGGRGRDRSRSSSSRSRCSPTRTRCRDDEGLVTLMTLHNAKGLEYPIVFMIGCEEGVFPHSRALDEGDARGGAAALLRRHHPRDARPLPHLRAPPQRVRRADATGCPAASSTRSRAELTDREASRRRRRGRRGAGRPPRGASRVAARSRDAAGAAFRIGDDVVHAAFGDGVVIGVEPGGIVVVRFAARRQRAQADGRLRADQEALSAGQRSVTTSRSPA